MLRDLLIKHRTSGVLMDTNIFVLYLIGSYDRLLVPEFKRTSMYTVDDYDWLNEYVSKFSKIVVTPQILAESWNFIEKLSEKRFRSFLISILPLLTVVEEKYIQKDLIIASNGFDYVGITDMSVIQAAKELNCLVLTDDLRAYSYFSAFEVSTININHLRRI